MSPLHAIEQRVEAFVHDQGITQDLTETSTCRSNAELSSVWSSVQVLVTEHSSNDAWTAIETFLKVCVLFAYQLQSILCLAGVGC